MGTGYCYTYCCDESSTSEESEDLETKTGVPWVLQHWWRTQIYDEHTPIISKSSYAVKWNGKSLKMSKYCDSVGNVNLNFDISDPFLWNWSLHESFESGYFILILHTYKHWNVWLIHGMKTNFCHLYSVISLDIELVLMTYITPYKIFVIYHLYLEHGEMDKFL